MYAYLVKKKAFHRAAKLTIVLESTLFPNKHSYSPPAPVDPFTIELSPGPPEYFLGLDWAAFEEVFFVLA